MVQLWQNIRIWIGVSIWIYGLFYVMTLVDLGRIAPLPNSMLVTQVSYCESPDCTQIRPQSLPLITTPRYYPGTETHVMQTDLVYDAQPSTMQALFFPKFSDDLVVTLNGMILNAPFQQRPLWNEPLLVPVSPDILHVGANQLRLELSGPLPGHLDLRPFFIGDFKEMAEAYKKRHFIGPGLARFVVGLMIMFTVGYIFVWLKRPIEKTYLWLGLSCASAIGFLLPLGVSFPMGGYREWRLLQTGSLSTYVLFMLMFIRSYLGLTKSWLEKLHVVGLVVGLAVMAVIPIQYVYTTSLLVGLIAITSALFIVVLFWQYRTRVGTNDFLIFFPTCSLALTFAFDALLLWLSGLPPRSLHLLHAMPLLTSIVCLWLVLSQLVKSLSDTERMTATLQQTIFAKSQELETSYAKLAEVEREKAVSNERRRIMLDLHDGIGGQLVSTLAYMENKDVGDDTLRMALEDALRDLALMLDSIENDDCLTTLLGMLRTRLEGLLADHGTHFDWQVEDEPVLPKPSPSANLHVARVVQEAITNVIKHAQARRITVKTDHSTIIISDDGVGFDVGAAQQASKGHGLIGMKRRAQQIGADLTIQSNEAGTRVTLSL